MASGNTDAGFGAVVVVIDVAVAVGTVIVNVEVETANALVEVDVDAVINELIGGSSSTPIAAVPSDKREEHPSLISSSLPSFIFDMREENSSLNSASPNFRRDESFSIVLNFADSAFSLRVLYACGVDDVFAFFAGSGLGFFATFGV